MFSEELFSSSNLGAVREDVPQAYGHLPVCGTNGRDRSRLEYLSSRGESVQLCSELCFVYIVLFHLDLDLSDVTFAILDKVQ